MRPVLCGLAAGVIALHAGLAHAQQGTVQLSATTQGITGGPVVPGENRLEPDFGVMWLQPGVRFGTFQIELRGARRADRLHLGRNYAALREIRYGGLSWTLEAGDAYFTRAIGDYGFSNLTTPAVTFSGGALSGRSTRGSLHIIGGRATAWRNIFGTDPDTLGQSLGMVRGSYHLTDRLQVLGRASRIKTSGLREFAFSIADSRQGGGGVKFALTPAIQLVADGSAVMYRRVDTNEQRRDGSFLVGTNFLLARGWVQLNAARFSPGDFPAMHDPLHDRESAFAAGEFDVWSRIRLFGGWEGVRTNIDPDLSLPASRDLPRHIASRGFGGVRLHIAPRTTLTLRAEEGDRTARPVTTGFDRESDTGVRSAELQSMFGAVTTYTRYSRRQNVEHVNSDANYLQDDVSTQLFMRISQSTQLFGLGAYTRHETANQAGSSYWQIGGGAQVQLWRRNLWIRGEGTASRNVDLLTRDFVPRESFHFGLNGELAPGSSIAVNIAADRTPLLLTAGSPWTTRSTVRFVQTFSTGSARVPAGIVGTSGVVTRARGTGTIIGSVFTDWNANGTQDPDEAPIENIPVRLAAGSTVTTRRDGEFSFLNVPAGPQEVGLDTGAVPIDFDPPAETSVSLELDRNITRRVSFGLIPLGTVRGRVVRDANGNGRVDPGEEPIEGAVLVLDGGARSEQVRRGAYRFDSIRSGDHVVSLLRDSLPEGAVISGPVEVPLALRRDQLAVEIDFVVTIEKRPENRRVFPPKIGAPQAPGPKPAAARPSGAVNAVPNPAASPAPTPPASLERVTTTAAPGAGPAPSPGGSARAADERFAIQVAALLDPMRAREIVRDLTRRGYNAYLLEPPVTDPDGPYRVRVGQYPTRAAATAVVTRLERARGEKLWVIREPATAGGGSDPR
jgi:cell division septation protein DedD